MAPKSTTAPYAVDDLTLPVNSLPTSRSDSCTVTVFFGKRRFGFASSVVVAASLEASASAADTVVASVLVVVVVVGLAKLLFL